MPQDVKTTWLSYKLVILWIRQHSQSKCNDYLRYPLILLRAIQDFNISNNGSRTEECSKYFQFCPMSQSQIQTKRKKTSSLFNQKNWRPFQSSSSIGMTTSLNAQYNLVYWKDISGRYVLFFSFANNTAWYCLILHSAGGTSTRHTMASQQSGQGSTVHNSSKGIVFFFSGGKIRDCIK